LTAQSVAVLAVHAKAQAAWLEQKKVTANSFHRQQRIEQVPAQTVERAENMARILSRHCSKSLWPNASALAYVLPQSKPTEKGFAITH